MLGMLETNSKILPKDTPQKWDYVFKENKFAI